MEQVLWKAGAQLKVYEMIEPGKFVWKPNPEFKGAWRDFSKWWSEFINF